MMLELGTFAHHWYASARGITLQAAFLIAIAALIGLAARKAAPQARYLLWLVVLVRLAIPVPFTSPLGLLSFSTPDRAAGTAAAVPSIVPNQGVVIAQTAPPGASSANTGALRESHRFDLITGLFLCWLGTILLLISIVGFRAWRTRRRLAAAALPPPPALEEQLAALCARVGVSRPPSILSVADPRLLSSPALSGLWWPTILLPSDIAEEWSQEDLDAVLLHELVHVGRHDHWMNALQVLIQLFFFFHPFVWWANRELRKERELAVDDRVVELLDGRPRGYAETLLRFAERPRRQERRLAGVLRMAEGRASLPRRIERLAARRIPSRKQRILASICLLLLASASLALAAQPAHHAPENTNGQFSIRVIHQGALRVAPDPANPKRLQWKTWKGDFKTGKLLYKPAPPIAKIPPGIGPKILVSGLVGPEGRVLDAAVDTVAAPVDAELKAKLLAYVKALRFSPTVGKDGTPLASRLAVIFTSPLPSQKVSSSKNGVLAGFVFSQALIPPAEAKPISEWKPAPLGGDIRPPKLLRKGKLELRTLPPGIGPRVTVAALIDAEGRIVDPKLATKLPAALSRPILAFVESLRFTPPTTMEGKRVGIDLKVVLDYGNSVARVAEAASAHVPSDWEAEMNRLYRLVPNQSLKLVPPPFSPARLGYYRTAAPIQSLYSPIAPAQMVVTWTSHGISPERPGVSFGESPTLERDLGAIGIPEYRLEGPSGLLHTVVKGDIVLRQGSSQKARLADLAKALAERGTPVRFTWTSETRPTIVARGTLGNPPFEGKEPLPTLHIYADREDTSGGGTGTVHDCLRWMAAHLGRPVADETTESSGRLVNCRLDRSSYHTSHIQMVLDNLERQSNLTFTIENRPLSVLRVSTPEK